MKRYREFIPTSKMPEVPIKCRTEFIIRLNVCVYVCVCICVCASPAMPSGYALRLCPPAVPSGCALRPHPTVMCVFRLCSLHMPSFSLSRSLGMVYAWVHFGLRKTSSIPFGRKRAVILPLSPSVPRTICQTSVVKIYSIRAFRWNVLTAPYCSSFTSIIAFPIVVKEIMYGNPISSPFILCL